MKISKPCTILWFLFCTLSAVANDVSEEDYDWTNDVTDSKRPNNMGAWAKRNEDDLAPFKMEGLKLFFSQKKKPATTKTSGTTIASSYPSTNCFVNTTDAARTGKTTIGKTSTGSTKKRTTKVKKTTTNFSTTVASNVSVDANQVTTTCGINAMANNETSDSSKLANNTANDPDLSCNTLTLCITPTTACNNATFTSTLSTTGSVTTRKSSSSTTKKGKKNPTTSTSSTSTSPTTKSKKKKKILKTSGTESLHPNKNSRWKKLHKFANLFKNADPQSSTNSIEQPDILEESDLQSEFVTIKNANESGEFVANSGDRENIKKQLYEKDQTRANTETNELHDSPTVLYPIPSLLWNTSSTGAFYQSKKLPENSENVQTAEKSLFSNNISTVLGTNSVDTFPNNAAEVHTINYEYQDTAQNEVEHDRDIKETAAIFTEVGKGIMKDEINEDLDNVEEEGKDIHKAERNSIEDTGEDNLIDTSAMPVNAYEARKNIEKETNLLNHENGLKSITGLINKENTDNQQENKYTMKQKYKDKEQSVNSDNLNNLFSDKNKEPFFDPMEESLRTKEGKFEKKSNSHEETLHEKLTQEEITQSRDDSYRFFIEKSTESYKMELISKEEQLSHTELNVDGKISKENDIQHKKESEILKPNPDHFRNMKEDEFGFNLASSQSNNESEFDARNEIYTLKNYPSFFLHSPGSDFYKTDLNYNLQKFKSFLNYMKQNEGILNDFFGIPFTEFYPIMKNDRYRNKKLNAEHQDIIFDGEAATSREQSNLEIHKYNDASTDSDSESIIYRVENKKNFDETIISPSKKAESLFGNTIKTSDIQTENYDLSEDKSYKSGFEKLSNVEHLQHNTEWSSHINSATTNQTTSEDFYQENESNSLNDLHDKKRLFLSKNNNSVTYSVEIKERKEDFVTPKQYIYDIKSSEFNSNAFEVTRSATNNLSDAFNDPHFNEKEDKGYFEVPQKIPDFKTQQGLFKKFKTSQLLENSFYTVPDVYKKWKTTFDDNNLIAGTGFHEPTLSQMIGPYERYKLNKTQQIDRAHKYGIPQFTITTENWVISQIKPLNDMKMTTMLTFPFPMNNVYVENIRNITDNVVDERSKSQLGMSTVYDPYLDSISRITTSNDKNNEVNEKAFWGHTNSQITYKPLEKYRLTSDSYREAEERTEVYKGLPATSKDYMKIEKGEKNIDLQTHNFSKPADIVKKVWEPKYNIWNYYNLDNRVTSTVKVLPINERTKLLPFSYEIPNATIMPADIPLSVNKNDPEWKDWIPINPIIKPSNSSHQNKSKSLEPSVYDSYNKIDSFFIPQKNYSGEGKIVTSSEESNTEFIKEDKTSYSKSDEEHSFKKGNVEMDSKMSDKKNYLEHLTEQSFNEMKLMKERPVKNASDLYKQSKKKHQYGFSHILTGRKGFAKKKLSHLENMEPGFDTEIHVDNIFPSLLSWDLLNGSVINQSKELIPLNEYMNAGQPDADSISLIQRLLNNSAPDIVPLSNATQDGNEFAAVKMSVVKIIHKLPSNVSKYTWITEKTGQDVAITRYSNDNFELVQNKETNKNEDQNPSAGDTSMTIEDSRNKQQSTGEKIDAFENQIKKEEIQNSSLFYTDAPGKWPPKENKIINKSGTSSEFTNHDFQNKVATNGENKSRKVVYSEKSKLASKNAQEKLEREKMSGVRPGKAKYSWKKVIQSIIDDNYLRRAGEEIVNRVKGSSSNQLNYIVNHNLGHLDLDRSALVKYLTKERVSFFDKQGKPGQNGRRNIKKRNVEKKKNTEKKMKSRELEFILQQNLPSLPLNKDEFINYMMTGMKKTTENSEDDRFLQYSKSRLQSVIDKNIKKPINHRMKMERKLKSRGRNRPGRWKNIPEYNLKKYERIY